MTPTTVALILTSAVIHATWNLLAKRAGSTTAFTVVFGWVAVIAYAPVVGLWAAATQPVVLPEHIAIISISALFQLAYFMLLNRAYKAGDISVVYPVARGSGPLFTLLGAMLILGERPSPPGMGAVVIIGSGVVILAGRVRGPDLRAHATSIGYALAVGLSIMAYTLWDKAAVATRHIYPLLVNWGVNLGVSLALAPYASRHMDEVREVWRHHRRAVIGVGLLSPLAYIIVLFALAISPVSSVAPMREISIVIGAVLGAWVLHEPVGARRLVGAGVITLGVMMLALENCCRSP